MPPPAPAKPAIRTAADICRGYKPDAGDRALLGDQMTPREFLHALTGAGRITGAIQFLAQVLPKREVVRWACLCVGRTGEAGRSPAEARALAAARSWVDQPSQASCFEAWEAAQAAGLETPAGLAAAAAFFSGKTMSPPDLPPTQPPDSLTGETVHSALLMAATAMEPPNTETTLLGFLKEGIALAEGKEASAASPQKQPG
jgi:hypothetical protein